MRAKQTAVIWTLLLAILAVSWSSNANAQGFYKTPPPGANCSPYDYLQGGYWCDGGGGGGGQSNPGVNYCPNGGTCALGTTCCGDKCCGAGNYCSRYGCTPQGAVECGGHYCNPGNYCSRGGGCVPTGNSDCGTYNCNPGTKCGLTKRQCIPDDAVDCGPVSGGGYCPADHVCTRDNKCLTEEQVEERRAEEQRKKEAETARRREEEQERQEARRRADEARREAVEQKRREDQEKRDADARRKQAEQERLAEQRRQEEQKRQAKIKDDEVRDRRADEARQRASFEKQSHDALIRQQEQARGRAASTVPSPVQQSQTAGVAAALPGEHFTKEKKKLTVEPAKPRPIVEIPVAQRPPQPSFTGDLVTKPLPPWLDKKPVPTKKPERESPAEAAARERRELGPFAPPTEAERIRDEAAAKAKAKSGPWLSEEERAKQTRTEKRIIEMTWHGVTIRCFSITALKYGYQFKTEERTCKEGTCSDWTETKPNNQFCR